METTFKGLNNKLYNLAPITVGDFARFSNWVQYQPYYDLLENDEITLDQKQAALDTVFMQCAKTPVTEAAVDRAAREVSGMIYLVYLSLRHNHNDISKAHVGDILTIDMLPDVSERISAISGLKSVEKKTPHLAD